MHRVSTCLIGLSDALQAYVVEHSTPLDDVLTNLAAETAALGGVANMQIVTEQGASSPC